MKYIIPFSLFISSIFCSCTGFKTATGTKITSVGGKQLVENSKAQFSILYYGDDWFHSFKSKNTLNYDQGFVNSIGIRPGKKLLLFTSHTTRLNTRSASKVVGEVLPAGITLRGSLLITLPMNSIVQRFLSYSRIKES